MTQGHSILLSRTDTCESYQQATVHRHQAQPGTFRVAEVLDLQNESQFF